MEHIIIAWLTDKLLAFQNHPKPSEYGKVHLPKLYAIFGVISFASGLISASLSAFFDEPLWFCVLLSLSAAIGAAMVVAFVNCRITYDEEGFVSKSIWGRKRKFTYNQVTAIKEDSHEKFIYLGEKSVMIDGFAVGGNDFIQLVKKKYRTGHNDQSLPKITKTS